MPGAAAPGAAGRMLQEELRFFPEQTPWARRGEEIPKRASTGKMRELTPAWAPALFFILLYPPPKRLVGFGLLLRDSFCALAPQEEELKALPGCSRSTEMHPVGSKMILKGMRWQLAVCWAWAGSGHVLGLSPGPDFAVAGPESKGLKDAWERCAGDCHLPVPCGGGYPRPRHPV